MKHLICISILALTILFSLTANAQDFFDGLEIYATEHLPQDVDADDFVTIMARAWGAKPRVGNSGSLLHRKFDEVFPSGLTLGTGDNIILFTNANAITQFLPSAGKEAALTQTYIDPASLELKNSFISELAALVLTVEFDTKIEDFASSPHRLGDCKVISGIFAGMKVDKLIQICHRAISGENVGYPIRALYRMTSVLNYQFVPGSFAEPIITIK